jgi:hypothetical protein
MTSPDSGPVRPGRGGTAQCVPAGAEPRGLLAPGSVPVPGQDRGRRWRAAVFLPAARGAVVAAGQRAAGTVADLLAAVLKRGNGAAFQRSADREVDDLASVVAGAVS